MQDQKQQNHNQQKKIALINDFTGFGRCSIAVQLPVISMMKVQCCAVPTAIFSDHTAYDSFYCTDYTAEMEPYIEEWKKLGLKFRNLYRVPGFRRADQIVGEFIHTFKEKRYNGRSRSGYGRRWKAVCNLYGRNVPEDE